MAGESIENRTCLIRFSSLGDILLTLPVIGPLARATGSKVVYITREPYRGLVGRHPDVGRVFTVPGRGSGENENITRLVENVNAEVGRMDFTFDLHDVPLSRCTLRGLNAETKSTYKKDGFRRLLLASTGVDILPVPTVPVTERYRRALEPAGVVETDYDWRLPVDDTLANNVTGELRLEIGYIAVSPRTYYGTKSWGRPGFVEVVKTLKKRGKQVVLMDDKPLGDWGAELRGAGAYDISGLTPLDILPEVLSKAGAVICNDSAPAHLATLLGVKAIDIFGPTSPRFGFALRESAGRVVYADYPCSPCSRHGKRRCWRGDNACMAAITPEQVVAVLDEVVGTV